MPWTPLSSSLILDTSVLSPVWYGHRILGSNALAAFAAMSGIMRELFYLSFHQDLIDKWTRDDQSGQLVGAGLFSNRAAIQSS